MLTWHVPLRMKNSSLVRTLLYWMISPLGKKYKTEDKARSCINDCPACAKEGICKKENFFLLMNQPSWS